MEHYFAYGSNLCLEQMKDRCPDAETVGRALLKGFCLAFPRRSGGWQGGVAGVVPAADDTVEGALYRISAGDLKNLDEYEGMAEGHYRRGTVTVQLAAGEALEALTYFAQPEGDGDFRPSTKYMQTILQGARDHGFSEAYIRRLERIEVAANR